MTYALAAVAGTAGLAVAFALFGSYGTKAAEPTVTGYRDITDTQVTIDFFVTKEDGTAATCDVRARNRAGAEVGRATVAVPAAGGRTKVSYTLATTDRPVTGETVGCQPVR